MEGLLTNLAEHVQCQIMLRGWMRNRLYPFMMLMHSLQSRVGIIYLALERMNLVESDEWQRA
jgi:hypothetical protein